MQIKRPWLDYYGDVPAHLDYPDMSMAQLMERTAERYPTQIACSFMGRHTRFRDFIEETARTARAMKALGVEKGARVLLCMPNVPQALYCFYAVNMLGAVAVMVHPLSAVGELRGYVADTKPVLIVTLDQFFDKFRQIAREQPLPPVVCARIMDALGGVKRAGYYLTEGRKYTVAEDDAVSWKRFQAGGEAQRGPFRQDAGADEPAVILFSGGTTGTTKGIVLTNRNFNALALQTAAMCQCLEQGNSMLAVMPVFHGFGLGVCIHTVLVGGCRCILIPRFNAKSYAGLLRKERPNYIAGVPTLFEALLRDDTLDGADLSCLLGVFSGGDSLSIELKKKFDAFLHAHGAKVNIREGYGTTECVTASCLTPYNIEKEGSIGLPFPDTDYQIVAVGTTDEVPYGETGEICLTGPSVMQGYLDMPEETAKVLRTHADGRVWLHTGDLGTMDEQGFVYFKQRIKRMIVSSGYSLYPSQLENVIDAHPFVKMSCVIGVPHPLKIQVPKAFVVLADGVPDNEETRAAIRAHCEKNIARYALPREIVIRADLPKTLVGKVAYTELEREEGLR